MNLQPAAGHVFQALHEVPDYLQLKTQDGRVKAEFGDKKLALNDGQLVHDYRQSRPWRTILTVETLGLEAFDSTAMSLADVAK
ncbi:hypothetical protein JET76_11460 [Pseudomonas putida]|uniref:Uncharacterized protein n=1 Tax=Pseudomonas putida TaxID=303 RepID=A0A7W2L3J4_PSEPU|nr:MULTISPECIES: hypothetical protein [Pseudomonas]MBA6117830.1 hypothetical protein [Pseudomonas putida]MBI6941958.1 hypothetical protein [Pseudomonas putida]MBI6958183.1 hypothetical protein [Pseudomonas putida]MCZ9638691.1 hypothetical protein [Pseudomonas putida]